MKIAVVSDDGKTISQHFGRAQYYVVLTIEAGKIANREVRDKLGHRQLSGDDPHHGEHGSEQHGFDEASHNKHSRMVEAISDCQVVLSGGMGIGAYESLRRLNLQTLITDISDIDQAVKAYLSGDLVDRTDKLH